MGGPNKEPAGTAHALGRGAVWGWGEPFTTSIMSGSFNPHSDLNKEYNSRDEEAGAMTGPRPQSS